MFLNNIKAYSVIHELERQLRLLVSETLSTEIGPDWWELVPEDIVERAAIRRDDDSLEAGREVETKDDIEYTDLSDLWAIMRNRDFRRMFNSDLATKLGEAEDAVSTIKTYRDTVMHNRVLTTAGVEQLADAADRLSELIPRLSLGAGKELARVDRDDFYRKVKLNELRDALRVTHPARELTNLPPPDFEDFIGRRKYLEDVCKRLRSKYYPIVSIDGVGGAGKSALAYAAAERIWHSPKRPFTALVYLSAKSTRLTPHGVESLVPTLTTYESMLDRILNVTGQREALDLVIARKEEVAISLLSTEPVLLILDNLETVTDNRVYEFIKDWEYPGKILITSRKRLGELERVIHLPQMEDHEAIALIRSVARSAGLTTIVQQPNEHLLPVVQSAGNIPLAIKWVLGRVALGRSLEDISRSVASTDSPILDFCFEEVFNTLSEEAQLVLMCLPLFERSPSQGALVAASGLDLDRFEIAIEDLVLASLVSPEIAFSEDSGEPETCYSALPLTLAYANRLLDKHPGLESEVLGRLDKFQKMLSAHDVAARGLRYSLQNIGATTDLARIAGFQALVAYQTYRDGDVERAREQFQQAHETDPTVHGVLLNWADMEDSEGNRARADELMNEAARLAPGDAKLWFIWGRLRQKSQHLKEAKEYLRKAVGFDPLFFWSRFHLSIALSWDEEYDEALRQLDACGDLPDAASRQDYSTMLLVGRAECLRRWGDQLAKQRNPKAALDKLRIALDLATASRQQQPGDPRSEMLYREVQEALGRAYFYERDLPSARHYLEAATFKQPVNRKEERHNSIVYYTYATVERAAGDPDKALTLIVHGLRTARNARRERLLNLRAEIQNEPTED